MKASLTIIATKLKNNPNKALTFLTAAIYGKIKQAI